MASVDAPTGQEIRRRIVDAGESEERTEVTANVSVWVSDRGVGVEVRDDNNQIIGETYLEIYEGILKSYVWEEERVGNDPLVNILKEFA